MKLWDLLVKLTFKKGLMVRIVLLRHAGEITAGQPSLPRGMGSDPKIVLHELVRNCVHFNREVAATKAVQWLRNEYEQNHEVNPVRFVYALTLFRALRYPAALTTWIVPSNPATMKDRDIGRSSLSTEWMNRLIELKIAQVKQGGFIGIHRLIKGMLRKKIEKEFSFIRDKNWPAYFHQCLADWYHKLFLASEDARAVFESVHHRIECASSDPQRGHPLAETADGHPSGLRESALREAINILHLSRGLLVSRGFAETTSSCLKEVSETVRNKLTDSSKDKDLRKLLDASCADLMLLVAAEVGNFANVHECLGHLKPPSDKTNRKNSQALTFVPRYQKAKFLIAVRSYSSAQKLLVKVCQELQMPTELGQDVVVPRQKASTWALQNVRSPILLKAAVLLLKRRMFIHMAYGHASYLASRRENSENRTAELLNANRCYHFASEIMRFIPDEGDEFIQIQNCHMRTQLGISLAVLGRYTEAHRRLREAGAFLSRSPKIHDSMANGVIALRTAQLLLIEVSEACRVKSLREEVMEGTRLRVLAPTLSDWWAERKRILALLDDAEQLLGRAEGYLSGHRKNVWWWTSLYELRLKAQEFSLVLRAVDSVAKKLEQSTLDLRHVLEGRRGRWTPRELLKEAIRLVRLDSFQLARVVESWATRIRILIALEDKLEQKTPEGQFLIEIIRQDRQLIRKALDRLNEVRIERDSFGKKCEAPLSDEVHNYVEMVRTDSSKLCSPNETHAN